MTNIFKPEGETGVMKSLNNSFSPAKVNLRLGGPATPSSTQPEFSTHLTAKVPLAAANTGGGVLSWLNPEAGDIYVQRLLIRVTTKSTDGTCTVDAGGTASSSTTSSDILLDGLDVGAATGEFNNIDSSGTNGLAGGIILQGDWLTISKKTNSASGLVGFAYITYTIL